MLAQVFGEMPQNLNGINGSNLNYFFEGSSDEQNTYWLADTFTEFMNSLICGKE